MKKITTLLVCFLLLFSMKGYSGATYSLDVVVYGEPANGNEFIATGYSINGEVIEYNGFTGSPSIHIAIIDSVTCTALTNCNRFFGEANIFSDPNGDCLYDPNTTVSNMSRPRPENYFIFRSNEPASVQAMAHLLDSAGNGNFILAYTWFPSAYSTMDTSINVFNRLGSTLFATIGDNLPFIFFCKKGDAGSVAETVGVQPNSLITLQTTFQCSPTHVNELKNERALVIFPNPASGEFTIQMKNHPGENVSVSVYDVLGNRIFEKNTMDALARITTDGLSDGFYFVRVKGEDYSSFAKVCIARE